MKKEYIKIIFVYILIVISIVFRIYKEDDINNLILTEDSSEEILIDDLLSLEDNNKIDYYEKLNETKDYYGNNDIVGILSIYGDDFSEIVMQSSDNEYYLRHTVYHDYDWRGQTFLDYRVDINDSKKLIIYGHNSNYYKLPFMIFENYYDEDYYNNHKYLYLQTDENINQYEIFSVYVEVSDWSYYTDMYFKNEQEYFSHIISLKNKSLYDTGVDICLDDEILIIQTCSTLSKYANYENSFLLVIGKKIKNI